MTQPNDDENNRLIKERQPGILFVLSGPSGTGKGTICRELLRDKSGLSYSISVTTRSPRPGEIDGENYIFVSREKFFDLVHNGELLEWAEVYGNYYGTPLAFVNQMLNDGQNVLLEVDTQGALAVKKLIPQGVFIYILPPSPAELADRITKRGTDSPAIIKRRLSCARGELNYVREYNYVVINDKVDCAVKKINAIIQAEKCRLERNSDLIDKIGGLIGSMNNTSN